MNNNFYHSISEILEHEEVFVKEWMEKYTDNINGNYVIFGSGKDGKECLGLFLKAGVKNIYIVDNNPAGKVLFDIPVSHCNIIHNIENPIIIIATRNFEDEIERQIWNRFVGECKTIISYTDLITCMIRDYLLNIQTNNENAVKNYNDCLTRNTPFMYGNFIDWNTAAEAAGDGYYASNILDRVAESTQMIRCGEGEFERDGVVFDKKDYNFQILTALLYVFSNENVLNVLDLGGALGSTYFQNRSLFLNKKINWNIVEQKNYVKYGKQNIPEIHFYCDVKSCFAKEDINCVVISNSLQYMSEAYSYLNEIGNQNKVKYVIFDSLPLTSYEEDIIMLQNVPASIYKATYPIRIFSKNKILELIKHLGYELILEWDKGNESDVVAFNSLISNIKYFGYLFMHS